MRFARSWISLIPDQIVATPNEGWSIILELSVLDWRHHTRSNSGENMRVDGLQAVWSECLTLAVMIVEEKAGELHTYRFVSKRDSLMFPPSCCWCTSERPPCWPLKMLNSCCNPWWHSVVKSGVNNSSGWWINVESSQFCSVAKHAAWHYCPSLRFLCSFFSLKITAIFLKFWQSQIAIAFYVCICLLQFVSCRERLLFFFPRWLLAKMSK